MNKRATAKDVADAAGFREQRSFVLNNIEGMRISEETRQKVLQAAEAPNYHPMPGPQHGQRKDLHFGFCHPAGTGQGLC